MSNPFATRYTRPNAGEYLFPAGSTADALVARLRDAGWWGQITGPHGSGKSTLLHTLLPKLHAAGRRVEIHSLHPPGRRRPAAASCGLPPKPSDTAACSVPAGSSLGRGSAVPTALWRGGVAGWNTSTQMVVDGCEQLGWLQRTWLRWLCRRHRAGLLVTAHRDLGLPQLWRTESSLELTLRIVDRLLGERDAEWLRAEQVERLFAEHGGNLREVLFALYDAYECSRHSAR